MKTSVHVISQERLRLALVNVQRHSIAQMVLALIYSNFYQTLRNKTFIQPSSGNEVATFGSSVHTVPTVQEQIIRFS
jgi:hypothetical protein